MKPRIALSILVLAVVVLGCPATAAVTNYTGELLTGQNLITIPAVPLDPDPLAVFPGIPIEDRLSRFNAANQSAYMYEELSLEEFGNILIGEGYWLRATAPGTFTFAGLDDVNEMDVWISLPRAPYSLIGNPYTYAYPWEDIKVTDGNTTVSMFDAAYVLDWVEPVGTYFDATSQSAQIVGFEDELPDSEDLLPGHGVWIQSKIHKLALIFEAKM